jgi:hypothetical protein
MGIWRRHTLRDDQGRRSQADSTATRRVCRRSIIGTRPGGHGKRARCRCGAPYRAVPGPCQDLERDAGSHRMLLVTSQRRAEGRADERFSAPPAPHGRRPDRYPLPPPRRTPAGTPGSAALAHARTRRRRGPSVAVRGKPAVTPTARPPRTPSAPRRVGSLSGCSRGRDRCPMRCRVSVPDGLIAQICREDSQGRICEVGDWGDHDA